MESSIREQDEALEDISRGLTNLQEIGETIHGEVNLQSSLLDNVENAMDEEGLQQTQNEIDYTNCHNESVAK